MRGSRWLAAAGLRVPPASLCSGGPPPCWVAGASAVSPRGWVWVPPGVRRRWWSPCSRILLRVFTCLHCACASDPEALLVAQRVVPLAFPKKGINILVYIPLMSCTLRCVGVSGGAVVGGGSPSSPPAGAGVVGVPWCPGRWRVCPRPGVGLGVVVSLLAACGCWVPPRFCRPGRWGGGLRSVGLAVPRCGVLGGGPRAAGALPGAPLRRAWWAGWGGLVLGRPRPGLGVRGSGLRGARPLACAGLRVPRLSLRRRRAPLLGGALVGCFSPGLGLGAAGGSGGAGGPPACFAFFLLPFVFWGIHSCLEYLFPFGGSIPVWGIHSYLGDLW